MRTNNSCRFGERFSLLFSGPPHVHRALPDQGQPIIAGQIAENFLPGIRYKKLVKHTSCSQLFRRILFFGTSRKVSC